MASPASRSRVSEMTREQIRHSSRPPSEPKISKKSRRQAARPGTVFLGSVAAQRFAPLPIAVFPAGAEFRRQVLPHLSAFGGETNRGLDKRLVGPQAQRQRGADEQQHE